MASKTGSQIIAIEEHYLDPEVSQHSRAEMIAARRPSLSAS